MDPMSALAIVAAVVQFVDIGARLVAKGREKHRHARDQVALLSDHYKQLSCLNSSIHEAARDLARITNEDANERMRVICEEADCLVIELRLIFEQPGSSKQRARAPRNYQGENFDDLVKRLNAFRLSVMEAALLFIWEDTRATRKHVLQFTDWMAEISHVLKGIDSTLHQTHGAVGLCSMVQRNAQQERIDPWRPRYEEWAISREGMARNFSPFSQAGQGTAFAEDTAIKEAAREMRSLLRSGASEALHDLRAELTGAIWDRYSEWRLLDFVDGASYPRMPSDAGFRSVARRIIHPFRFEDFSARETAVASNILETYSWVFNHRQGPGAAGTPWSNFPDWLERPEDPIYWITGKPGAGKSTIMKYIQGNPLLRTHLTKWAGNVPLLVTSYYAWHAGTTPQKSIRGLKQSLIYQVLDQYPDLIPILAPRRWVNFWLFQPGVIEQQTVQDWEVEECFDGLMAISGSTISLAVLIDGLDEFDVPPREVVALVEAIAGASRNGIKICVASRPWVEFEDAYSESPKLQMDLYTGSDMEIFVAERFRKCRAFSELLRTYPTESMNLQRELTRKANGVFIWLSLVVDALELAATEGAGIFELRRITDSLPTDMCSLYDIIWLRIPPRVRESGAILIQVVEAANFALDWAFFWLLDEYACREHDLSPAHLHSVEEGGTSRGQELSEDLRISLKRKLASRTRGILVDTPEGGVNFTHRTAREWAIQPKVWTSLQQACRPGFDPNLLLLEVLTVKVLSKFLFRYASPTDLWFGVIERALQCASRVAEISYDNVSFLVRALDTLDARVSIALDQIRRNNHGGLVAALTAPPSGHWSSRFAPLPLKRNTFIHLAAQFNVLPYLKVKAVTESHVLFQPSTRENIGILEAAIFGYRFRQGAAVRVYNSDFVNISTIREYRDDEVCSANRLGMVKFLLDSGVDQFRMLEVKENRDGNQYGWHMTSLRDYINQLAVGTGKTPEVLWYYSEVARMLGKNSIKTGARVAVMWVKAKSKRKSMGTSIY